MPRTVRAARSVVAAFGPALAVALTWGALESPTAWGALALAALLGLVPAAVVRPGVRAGAAVAVVVVGVSAAFTASPLRVLPWTDGTWLGDILGRVEGGLRAFEVVVLPFDPAQRPAMHALTQTAVLGFSLAAALAVAEGRPLLAGAVVVVGGGWATASVPDDRVVLVGGLLLVATLWPSVVLRARAGRDTLAALTTVAVVTVVGVGAAAAGVAPDHARLDWRSWSLLGTSRSHIGVRYVWDGQYDGIRFPARPTTVLRIRGPRLARYWRASTLDLFTADRWIESLYPVVSSPPTRRLPDDPLLPEQLGTEDLIKQTVEVVALDDDHLVAAGQPVRLQSETLDRVFFFSGGVMRVQRGVPRGARYTVWSYAPRPSPRELLASRPRYPAEVQRFLDLDRSRLPGFGVPRRASVVDRILTDDRYLAIRPYRALWNDARVLAERARSPYEATLAVERWLRSTGGFRYTEQPPVSGSPPLVDFVTRHRSGYCQHFAGAMAVMLRTLGIPARVAVGFTSGKWNGGEWVVSDLNAHAWVEAWFDGYGWLPFDPTPGRGSFSASYTLASDSADTVRALGRGELLAVLPETDAPGRAPRGGAPAPVARAGRSHSAWPIVLLAALLAIPLLGLMLVKAVLRRARYLTRDPRRLATAARSELVAVLRDQGVTVHDGVDMVSLRSLVERNLGVSAAAFAAAHGRARYGPPGRAGGAADEMRAELAKLRRVLRERLALPRRVQGALSWRSLRRA